MRLLHAKTLTLHEFSGGDEIPQYAVLSHTWGAPSDEVTRKDLSSWTSWCKRKAGWAKVKGCCRQALTDEIEYVWIDTCCIDRSDPADVAAAVESMWKYYTDARVCYVHLADVQHGTGTSPESPNSDFRRSRWFTRGWTLPELLAPLYVRFYDAAWKYIGAKAELSQTVEDVTGISARILRDPGEVGRQSVACRMAWVARRETARREDLAYCLLGLFSVSMPIEYGEGRAKAFVRLQHQILASTRDPSIFAWGLQLPLSDGRRERKVGILAETPSAFEHCAQVAPLDRGDDEPAFETTGTGLRVLLPVLIDGRTGTALLNTECVVDDCCVVLPLTRSSTARNEFGRAPYSKPVLVPKTKLQDFAVRPINMQLPSRPHAVSRDMQVSIHRSEDPSFELVEVYPPNALQDIQTPPPEAAESVNFYLVDLPWAILSFKTARGHRFLVSLERGSSSAKSEPRGINVQIARAPSLRSSAGGSSRVPFTLVQLLPVFEAAPTVAWEEALDLGGLAVSSQVHMPGGGNNLRTVRLHAQRTGSEYAESSRSSILKKSAKRVGSWGKEKGKK
ncbi:Uu.00g117870.m01.CDS01 [Anthostomella pinea]|uniref:Uu.00g117870.m01.CDS01 n=1 Tax=Anthostomella pinea TaxID=933095 RepID=A0AAI8YEJ7_9PEZI|nr:Uu.00g117870.m01.CDS01 [Anthostomella pinea]